jgi:hypothetical protein
MNSKIDGRIDVTRDTQINLQLRGIINTDNPGSPNLTAGLAKLPLNFDVGQTVGITQQFNRLTTTFKGTFDRATYDNSLLTDGTISSNADRNFNQYAGIGRFAYELDPGLKPFVEFEGDQRVHDEQYDRSGLQRESVGVTGKVGAAVNLFELAHRRDGNRCRGTRLPRPDAAESRRRHRRRRPDLAADRTDHRQAQRHLPGLRNGAGRRVGRA